MTSAWRRLLFNAGSAAYDALTYQAVWSEQIARMLDHVDEPGAVRSVLDLGCGPGISTFVLADRLPEASIDGIDVAERMIARAKQHYADEYPDRMNLRFHTADATSLPWPDDTFDLAIGHSFLYLVPDRARVLEQACRVLRPGGTLVLLEPNRAGSLRAAAGRHFGHELDEHPPMDVARFGMSMFAWRIVSGSAGRLEPVYVRRWLLDAGFGDAEIVPTLGGLGIHCIGRVAASGISAGDGAV